MTAHKPVAVLSAMIRPMVEPHLPPGIDARFFSSVEELHALAQDAEIGWFDMNDHAPMIEAVRRAGKLKWLNSIYAGLDFLPLDLLGERGVTITNGAGINAIAIAEYVMMGMLNIAKDYRAVVRAQDARTWLGDSPGKMELAGTRALLLGYGAIGQQIAPRLAAFGVEVVPVRRSQAGDGVLGPDEWRARLGEFDWVVLAVPATAETEDMIGADELAAMKNTAVLINIARGTVVDQDALVAALGEENDRWGDAGCDDARTAARRPSSMVVGQCPCDHASVGPRAEFHVCPFCTAVRSQCPRLCGGRRPDADFRSGPWLLMRWTKLRPAVPKLRSTPGSRIPQPASVPAARRFPRR